MNNEIETLQRELAEAKTDQSASAGIWQRRLEHTIKERDELIERVKELEKVEVAPCNDWCGGIEIEPGVFSGCNCDCAGCKSAVLKFTSLTADNARLRAALEKWAGHEPAHELSGNYHVVCDFCGACCDSHNFMKGHPKHGQQRCDDGHASDCPVTLTAQALSPAEGGGK